jgi:predicted nucleic acid-binding protein
VIPVFDSWAVLALIKHEPAAIRVQPYWEQGDGVISVVNYTEVLYRLIRDYGADAANAFSDEVLAPDSRLEVVEAAPRLARLAADIKAKGGLSLADAYAAALTREREGVLLTGDPELQRAANVWGFALEWLGR